MSVVNACLECAAPLEADAPEGLCPNCLLGLAANPSGSPQPGTTPFPSAGFVAPSPAELASRFPQLEILELLGQGGMGAVYKARQPKLDRLVAVKILPPEWDKDPAFAERFAREAKALARLTHPHIVAVHDFGETDGLYYLIMEYVDGANLRHVLQEGRLKPSEALGIVPQICDALQYAHEEGVVHRDIKPENILLDSKGRVKIADFGLAKLLNRPRAAFTLTGSQQVMGTLDYMAPEQRLRPQEVDHRADIYSLGVVFYEMLTGELPLGRFEPPSHKARVDARLDEIVFRALEREPHRRYQRASHVKSDVQSIAAGRAPAIHDGDHHRAIPVADDAPGDHFPIVAPAAGLMLAGVIGILFWTILGLMFFVLEHRHPGSAAFLLMPALGIPAGLGLIFGAVRMMRCQSYHWALGSAIWATIPWSPGWLIGLPCGILALVALRKPSIQAAFGIGSGERNPVLAPAIGVCITGIGAGLFWSVLGLSLFASGPPASAYHFVNGRWTPIYVDSNEHVLFLLMPLLALPAAAVLVIGARRMIQRNSYQFAVLAAMWATVPWSPFWLVGLPFGILALRALRRRDVQLAFGRPFHPHERAFEAPVAAIPVAAVAIEPPMPARRGVGAFLGSMYSLMFQSRLDLPAQSEASAPAVAAVSASSADPGRALRTHVPPHRPTAKRNTVAWVVGIVLASILIVGSVVVTLGAWMGGRPEVAWKSVPIQHGVLMDKYNDLNTTLHFEQYGLRDSVRRVFESTEQEYLALEARYTKRERKADGHVTVTIGNFSQEEKQLETRFFKKLEAMYEIRHLMNQIRELLPENSLFPFGAQEARIELWRDNGQYHGKVCRKVPPGENKGLGKVGEEQVAEEFSGPELPMMYKRFWTN
jgi:tRNA A-37 threonylcarbamoyl transferase component Bud32